MFYFILFATIALASANANSKYDCMDQKAMDNFDFNAYAQGTWYELARYTNKVEGQGQCGYSEYTLGGEGFKIKDMDYFEGKLRIMKGSGRLAPDAGTFAKMIYTYPYGPNGSLIDNPVNIVYTDYKNFALVYYCRFNAQTQKVQEYAWVQGRSKSLDAESKNKVDKLLKESSFLDTSRYNWVNFSDESCKA